MLMNVNVEPHYLARIMFRAQILYVACKPNFRTMCKLCLDL